jgi:2-iminobutanoate/2-iminopropanoate deaminase
LHPYIAQLIDEERRAELLRSADAWRLAHPVYTQTATRTRWWNRPLPWLTERRSVSMTITRTGGGVGLPAGFPFSLAAEASGLCFLSGMVALGADGTFASGTVEEEAELAWQNVAAVAEASGCSIGDIVYVQCVLRDMDDYGGLNAWWRRQFPDGSTAPARFTFQAGLPLGAKIEIQAVAARNP